VIVYYYKLTAVINVDRERKRHWSIFCFYWKEH